MHISFLLAEAGKANEEGSKVLYAVTNGIASFQTRKKYAYYFRRFVEHFDGITKVIFIDRPTSVCYLGSIESMT
ncbi:MAG: hypothetical protein ACRD8Z_07200 [Nitrososphaeraceae archaeon]